MWGLKITEFRKFWSSHLLSVTEQWFSFPVWGLKIIDFENFGRHISYRPASDGSSPPLPAPKSEPWGSSLPSEKQAANKSPGLCDSAVSCCLPFLRHRRPTSPIQGRRSGPGLREGANPHFAAARSPACPGPDILSSFFTVDSHRVSNLQRTVQMASPALRKMSLASGTEIPYGVLDIMPLHIPKPNPNVHMIFRPFLGSLGSSLTLQPRFRPGK